MISLQCNNNKNNNNIYSTTNKEKMEWERLKNEGNNLLKEGDFQGAIGMYSEAIDKLEAEGHESRHILFSNRSAAYLKSGDLDQALRDANECVTLSPDWAKGYSRQAAVLKEMRKFTEAVEATRAGLSIEPSNVALKTIMKACETCQVCDKLKGTWHGKVADEVGGYMQSFEFLSDTDVRVMVLGTVVDAEYDVNVQGTPYPHLDMRVPGSPGSAFVRHIYKFVGDDELHLCSPYLKPPEERPTSFQGAGMVIMKRGPYVPSEQEQREKEETMLRPLEERVVVFLQECIEAVPDFDVRPMEGENEVQIGSKLTANVKFQTFYQGLIERLGADAELKVKEYVVGNKDLNQETDPRIVELAKTFHGKMRAAGLISDTDSTNELVGVPPAEAMKDQESIRDYISGAQEPLADVDESIYLPTKASSSNEQSAEQQGSDTSNAVPMLVALSVVVLVAGVVTTVLMRRS